MPRKNGFTLTEFSLSIALIGMAFGMLRGAVLLIARVDDAALPGIMALSAFSLIGAVVGNNIAILTMGREYAMEGVILGGTLLSPPLMFVYIQAMP